VSLHTDALAVLAAWQPPTRAQADLRDRYVAHLHEHADGVWRECYPDHLTASTLVLSRDLEMVLLTLHAKARRWFQLGGHCEDSDPTLVGAAAREAREESGLADLALDPRPVQLSEHAVPFCDPRGGVHHLDVRFVAVVPDDARHSVSVESLDVRWWPVDDLPDPQPDMVELVALAVARSLTV
jgi:8-oxo-dGTP pyrophosphatase MutT (NUDIX family)